jgi:hypothetical protein
MRGLREWAVPTPSFFRWICCVGTAVLEHPIGVVLQGEVGE